MIDAAAFALGSEALAAVEATPASPTKRLDMSTGNRVHPISERGADLYETPLVAVRALLEVERIPKLVWYLVVGPARSSAFCVRQAIPSSLPTSRITIVPTARLVETS